MQRFILPAISLILLCGCSIGPQFDQKRAVDCGESSNETNALAEGHTAAMDAGMKGEESVAPAAGPAAYLGGDYPEVARKGESVRTLDYASALELRSADVNGACVGAAK